MTASVEQIGAAITRFVRANPVVLALVAVITIFSILYPTRYWQPLNISTLLREWVTLSLFALGPSIVVVTGALDLSFVGIWMLGGVLLWMLTPILGLSAILVFPLLGIVSGFLTGVIQVKARIPSFILTLSLLVVFAGLSANLSGGYARPVRGYEFLTATLIPNVPTALFWATPLIAAAIFIMLRTHIGTYLYAIGSNEEGAALAGINVGTYKVLAFTLSGVFTGLGSMILFQHMGGASPVELNLNTMVWPLVAIVLGGTSLAGGSGGPHRTLLGALTFAALDRGLVITLLHPEAIRLLLGLLLIASVIVGARGLKGVAAS